MSDARPGRTAPPPALAERMLCLLVAEEDRAPVLDELRELYEVQCARKGVAEARRWYSRQVFGFAWQLARHGRRRGVKAVRSGFASAMRKKQGQKGGVEMGRFAKELRHAARRLVRAPVFTAVSVLTIGVGIGAFTSIFSLVEAVLIEPMPYQNPNELHWVWRNYLGFDLPRGWLGGPDIANLREQSDVFAGVVAFTSGGLNLAGLDGSDPQQVIVNYSSYELFDLLGVRPHLG